MRPRRGKDEAMVSVKTFVCAAAAAILSTTAYAADMAVPQMSYQAPVAQGGAWYLRGGMGIGLGSSGLDYLENPLHTTGFVFDQHSMADTTFYNVGVGYEVNNWLRFDITGEYRDKTQVNARGTYNVEAEGDAYQGYLRSAVFLFNGYADLGTWWCLTPFVGAGVGAAWNQMADLVDQGIGTTGYGFGRNSSNWSPAWALYAGIDYNVTQNFKIELAYRYLNYGSVTDTVDCAGGCIPDSYKWTRLQSNDLMLGFRWNLYEAAPVIGPPIRTKG
jgi:opacity protein-like surface antigen